MQKNNFVLTLILLLSLGINHSFAQNIAAENESLQNNNQKLTTDKIDQSNFSGTAVLQGLNKITAKTSELRIGIGNQIEFGKLIIKAKKCWKSPLDQRPENKVLLQVEEIANDNTKKTIFNGWMFSSSPSISGLEHPVYDITVIECK